MYRFISLCNKMSNLFMCGLLKNEKRNHNPWALLPHSKLVRGSIPGWCLAFLSRACMFLSS